MDAIAIDFQAIQLDAIKQHVDETNISVTGYASNYLAEIHAFLLELQKHSKGEKTSFWARFCREYLCVEGDAEKSVEDLRKEFLQDPHFQYFISRAKFHFKEEQGRFRNNPGLV